MFKLTYKELEQQRDELAAQVARLRMCVRLGWTSLCMVRPLHFPGDLRGIRTEMQDALEEAPHSALAALKAQWQAEYEHCDHKYARFGDQPHRRCIKCAGIEPAQEAGDA